MKSIFALYIAIGDRAATGGVHDIINEISSRHYQFKVMGIMQGLWEENPQDTLLVHVSDDEEALKQTTEKLKEYLQTDEVWFEDIHDTFQ